MTYDWRNKTIAQQLMSAELLPLFYSENWDSKCEKVANLHYFMIVPTLALL